MSIGGAILRASDRVMHAKMNIRTRCDSMLIHQTRLMLIGCSSFLLAS